MITKRTRLATFAAAAIAAVAPAALIAGAGTAHAMLPLEVSYNNNGFGTVASIADPNNAEGAIEICHYSSHVSGNPYLFPYYAPVQLSGKTASQLQIFGIQTGTTYDVTVKCNVGGTYNTTQTF